MRTSQFNLDANASHGLLPEVSAALLEQAMETFNPSSIHQSGQRARAQIELARDRVSEFLAVPASYSVIFTSGASEANNLAISQAQNYLSVPSDLTVLASAIEHPSVLEPLKVLSKSAVDVIYISPHESNETFMDSFLENLSEHVGFVVCMLANNETGKVMPVAELFREIRKRQPSVLTFCDAVQAVGRMPINISELQADLITISGHKFGSLPGVGALLASDRVKMVPQIRGGVQEQRLRAGTENVLGIASMGVAAKVQLTSLQKSIEYMQSGKNLLRHYLTDRLVGIKFNQSGPNTLPNTLSVTVDGIVADDLVVAMDVRGVNISSGAACASGKPEPSHVLLASGLSEHQARSTIRLSLPSTFEWSSLQSSAEQLVTCIEIMRRQYASAAA